MNASRHCCKAPGSAPPCSTTSAPPPLLEPLFDPA
jgi:hypothetical protein